MKKLLTKSDQTDTVDHKHSSGKKCTAQISPNTNSAEELVLSQDSALGTHKTIHQIVQNIGISKKTSVHRIDKWDVKLQRFRLHTCRLRSK